MMFLLLAVMTAVAYGVGYWHRGVVEERFEVDLDNPGNSNRGDIPHGE